MWKKTQLPHRSQPADRRRFGGGVPITATAGASASAAGFAPPHGVGVPVTDPPTIALFTTVASMSRLGSAFFRRRLPPVCCVVG